MKGLLMFVIVEFNLWLYSVEVLKCLTLKDFLDYEEFNVFEKGI